MAGRPVDIQSVIIVQKLRKKGVTFRDMQKIPDLKNKDLKTLLRWSKYNVGKIVKQALDV